MKTTLLKPKSQAALSTLCWGVYVILNGLSMTIDPEGTLKMMGFSPGAETGIRMAGLLALVLGFYYVQMGRHNFVPFYTWKVIGHVGGILIMTLFYFQNLVPASIFIICFSDGLAALWTSWGLIYDRKKSHQAVMA
ncbi:hypothetical protein [Cesiribacter sp. SM1]|uniref:hypothetical protein n=1 Tax=Cesiribacter sp. SM1 TaxID=2861196 RepID=UPI001CD53320|nr:hypothetical protein [Cesiribacter sp. SM1]